MKKGFTLISKACERGFTLIEMLVVISIIGIIIAVSLFGLAGIRQDTRDNRRKTDLESIKSGLELYKSDCGDYPTAVANCQSGKALCGDGTPVATCPTTNTYISSVPKDPNDPTRTYIYAVGANGTTYELCTSLEQGSGTVTCGGLSNCGSSPCNYKVTNP